ncbi:MAG: DUF2069 domain-containing protein [Castellaniella sp.]|uniref:DUF2069 domain-containing protein n=1 Tax=Castellaniella sp. TaxID=1955812 RepID=UPI001206013B|nr:DUF2069 domain-containing protein [Castellaniella sp.]TAN30711.1 MAG: DUF2069 domain-containing protein [Castellaniella sp.]
MEAKLSRGWHLLAAGSLIGLFVLCVGWELWWAPVRPGGSLLALKALPLLFALRGVLKGSLYTLQWTAMLSLLYLMEGVVRAWSDLSTVSAALAGVEIVLSLGLYLGAVLYVRPAKRAAKQAVTRAARHG